jgi:hydrogenase maturation protease
MKTLVIGLGNPILTDDGAGVLAARQVAGRLAGKFPIEVAELSVGGLRLMEAMIGYDRVILIDALESKEGRYGTIHRLSLQDLSEISPTQHSSSPHDASLTTAIEMGRRMSYTLPKEIVIFAIEVENTSDFGEAPTPAVAQAIPELVEQVLAEIGKT